MGECQRKGRMKVVKEPDPDTAWVRRTHPDFISRPDQRRRMTDEVMDPVDYQAWEKAKLMDIDKDTDTIIEKMGSKSGKMAEEGFNSGMLTGLLSQRGVDPSMLAMLKDNDGLGGNGLLFLLFLLLLGGNGGYWGNNGGVDRTVINEGNFNQLMQAVTQTGQAQTAAVQSLANSLNTDMVSVNAALASMDKQLAVNAGDIRSAIQSCCCNIRTELQQVGNSVNLGMLQGFNGLQGQMAQGFNAMQGQASQIAAAQAMQADQNTDRITGAIADLQTAMTAGFCDIRTRELEAEVQRLRDLNAQQRDTANTQAILTALQNKDTIGWSGTVNGTTVTGTGTLS